MNAEARRERDLANIQAAVARNLAAAPPFTEEQVTKLRGLLRTSAFYKTEEPAVVQHQPDPTPVVPRILCTLCGTPYPAHYYGHVGHDMVWPEGVIPHSDLFARRQGVQAK